LSSRSLKQSIDQFVSFALAELLAGMISRTAGQSHHQAGFSDKHVLLAKLMRDSHSGKLRAIFCPEN
jgi:hypothetical protein